MSDEREHAKYRRDYIIHKLLMVFVVLMLCAISYLAFELVKSKAPLPVEDNLSEPTFYIAPDNRKELNLK